ncbi:MAG: sigma-70 family RNA polymerase sigma factor [Candidatus Peribacteraceae bacterium]|nr:sigma-70 family RNA polymerase sigma factor [Candidatus Peribacteraceae bacterium]
MLVQPFSPEELSDLVSKAQQGDTDAFGKIYDGYLTPVYRYVVFRFPEDMAEDLTADIFVKAWEKLHSYKPYTGVPFSAWLFRIARHAVIDAYRSQRGFEEVSEDLVDEDVWNDPMATIERQLSVQTVRGALSKLPGYYREILLLHYVSDLSHSEVAKALKLTEGFVRVLKHRALKKLEVILKPLSTSGEAAAASRLQS